MNGRPTRHEIALADAEGLEVRNRAEHDVLPFQLPHRRQVQRRLHIAVSALPKCTPPQNQMSIHHKAPCLMYPAGRGPYVAAAHHWPAKYDLFSSPLRRLAFAMTGIYRSNVAGDCPTSEKLYLRGLRCRHARSAGIVRMALPDLRPRRHRRAVTSMNRRGSRCRVMPRSRRCSRAGPSRPPAQARSGPGTSRRMLRSDSCAGDIPCRCWPPPRVERTSQLLDQKRDLAARGEDNVDRGSG